MKKLLRLVAAVTALACLAGCGGKSNPTGSSTSNNNSAAVGVSTDLIGTWAFFYQPLDTVMDSTTWVFSKNNIVFCGTSIVGDGAQAMAKGGNIGYVYSTMIGYLFDYSLSAQKDSVYIVSENTPTAYAVCRDSAAAHSGIYVKR